MRKILLSVKIKKKSPSEYRNLMSVKSRGNLIAKAKGLKGVSVLNINSTADGGGVAELLQSQIPLERGLGIDSRWVIINNDKEDKFFSITKKIHNFLQGGKGSLTENEKRLYFLHNECAFGELRAIIKRTRPDIVVIHDPQPLPLIDVIPKNIKTVFRLHIDLSRPNKKMLDFLKPMIARFDYLVVSHAKYRPKWFPETKTKIIYPAIDPLAPKNKIMPKDAVVRLAQKYGINPKDKIVSQISRFDPWKDPIGVIKAFNIARKKISGLKLILIGSTANDDPEAKEVFEEVKKFANNDADIMLFTRRDNILVNVIQSVSAVILQKSIREGFGLTVSEGMWKKKPVIGGKTAGIALQINDGKNGYLTVSVKQTADLIVKLFRNPRLAKKMGDSAHKTVRDNFVTPVMVLKHLNLYSKLMRK